MARRVLAAALPPILLLVLALPVFAQDALVDLGSKGARVTRAAQSGQLAPSGQSRADTVRNYLRARLDEATLAELVPSKDHDFEGIGHADFRQRVAGLDVYGTYVRASFGPDGRLLSIIENLVSAARALRPAQIGPDAALRAVMARYYPGVADDLREVSTVGELTTFERRGPFSESPTATRVALPLQGAILDTGFLVVTWDNLNVLRHTVVSGRGQILHEELRTNTDSYRVFANHPNVSAHTLVNGPAPGTSVASPNGWLGTSTTTIGNNVDAYLDRNNDNVADTGGRPVSSTQNFDFAWNGSISPTDPSNQPAAVTNLFYLNNVLHDRLYGYGFTESAGNFQTDNFNRGGAGNDPVNAEAQDGGGTNNANFATPSDGSRPRMQMYIWTNPTPDRDGDLDSDIVYHEYGHGLTWRMIGDMSRLMAGSIGEGMSDTLSTYFNGDDRVAEYSYGNSIGIRSAPYTNYGRTYGDFSGTSVHFNGEIYAATMWRLRELWLSKGWDTELLLRYIVDGMNYTPSRPAFEDMRDGILQSVTNLSTVLDKPQARCTVWDAFAQFGIGVGADGVESCNIFTCSVRVTESFAKPSECSGTPANTAPTVAISSPVASGGSTSVTQGSSVTFTGSATDAEEGNLSSSLVWTSSVQGQIGTGGSFPTSTLNVGTHTITAAVTDGGGLSGSATITVTVTENEPAPGISLSAVARKVKGNRFVDLTWSGATTSNVTVIRNTTTTFLTPNDGAHTDALSGKGGGSFTYQVCNSGTSTCSNTVTVTF